MENLSQKDPRWKDIQLGTCKGETIGRSGCYITCLAMLAGITPTEVNQILMDKGGYASGCLVINNSAFAALGLPTSPNVYPCIAWTNHYSSVGVPQHFYIMLDDKNIIDPLDGKTKVNPYNIIQRINVTSNNMEQAFDLVPVDGTEIIAMRTWNGYEGIPSLEELHKRFGPNPKISAKISQGEYNGSLVDGWREREASLNGQINDLRGKLANSSRENSDLTTQNAGLRSTIQTITNELAETKQSYELKVKEAYDSGYANGKKDCDVNTAPSGQPEDERSIISRFIELIISKLSK